VAEVVARLATSSRSVYAERVVNKLQRDGLAGRRKLMCTKPETCLCRQFLKFVGEHASKDNGGLYHYSPLSKWNLAQNQGLADSFQRWAWQQLEAQDRPSLKARLTGSRFGVSRLSRCQHAALHARRPCSEHHLRRVPQPARATSGDRCNAGGGRRFDRKMWKVHQLMGALEINIPLDRVEARAEEHNRLTFMVVLGLLLSGMLCIGFLVIADVRARAP